MGRFEQRAIKKCSKCDKDMVLRFSPKNSSYFVGCTGFPLCRETYNIPLGDLVNHLLLARNYAEFLVNSIIEDPAVQRGDSLAIDELTVEAIGIKEKLKEEAGAIKDYYEPLDF